MLQLPFTAAARLMRMVAQTTPTKPVVWLAVLLVSSKLVGADRSETSVQQIRVLFSTRMMSEVNENDARAAVKAWTRTVLKERGIDAEAAAEIVDSNTLIREFIEGSADAASMTTYEYLALSRKVQTDRIFVGVNNGEPYEEYLLLVHQDSPFKNLTDLRGQKLAVLDHPRMSLAQPWLDTLLAGQKLPRLSDFFITTTHRPKPANVVLPVFFRTADACLVTRRVFETMAELNPQVGRCLNALATSPRLVPSLFCFRAGFQSPVAAPLRIAIPDLHRTPSGQQILEMFQFAALEERPDSCLQSARELLARYEKLRGSTAIPDSVATPPASEPKS